MNSTQIDNVLRSKCRGQFCGVYAIDKLPRVLPAKRPLILVCNTDPHDKPGEHWVALSIDGSGHYFDSFGRRPPREIELFMNRNCSQWSFNDRQLQSAASRFCGQYCIFYCLYKSIGYDSAKIIKCFTKDTGLNDVLAHAFVCKLLK